MAEAGEFFVDAFPEHFSDPDFDIYCLSSSSSSPSSADLVTLLSVTNTSNCDSDSPVSSLLSEEHQQHDDDDQQTSLFRSREDSSDNQTSLFRSREDFSTNPLKYHGSCDDDCKKRMFHAVIHCNPDDIESASKVKSELEKLRLTYAGKGFPVRIAILQDITNSLELASLEEVCKNEMTKVVILLRTRNYENDESSKQARHRIISGSSCPTKKHYDVFEFFFDETVMKTAAQLKLVQNILYKPKSKSFKQRMKHILTGESFLEQVRHDNIRCICEERLQKEIDSYPINKRTKQKKTQGKRHIQTQKLVPSQVPEGLHRTWGSTSGSDSSVQPKQYTSFLRQHARWGDSRRLRHPKSPQSSEESSLPSSHSEHGSGGRHGDISSSDCQSGTESKTGRRLFPRSGQQSQRSVSLQRDCVNASVQPINDGRTGTGDAGRTGTGDAGRTETGDAGRTGTGDAGRTGTGDAGRTGTGDARRTGTGDVGRTGIGDAGRTETGDAGRTGIGDAGRTEIGGAVPRSDFSVYRQQNEDDTAHRDVLQEHQASSVHVSQSAESHSSDTSLRGDRRPKKKLADSTSLGHDPLREEKNHKKINCHFEKKLADQNTSSRHHMNLSDSGSSSACKEAEGTLNYQQIKSKRNSNRKVLFSQTLSDKESYQNTSSDDQHFNHSETSSFTDAGDSKTLLTASQSNAKGVAKETTTPRTPLIKNTAVVLPMRPNRPDELSGDDEQTLPKTRYTPLTAAHVSRVSLQQCSFDSPETQQHDQDAVRPSVITSPPQNCTSAGPGPLHPETEQNRKPPESSLSPQLSANTSHVHTGIAELPEEISFQQDSLTTLPLHPETTEPSEASSVEPTARDSNINVDVLEGPDESAQPLLSPSLEAHQTGQGGNDASSSSASTLHQPGSMLRTNRGQGSRRQRRLPSRLVSRILSAFSCTSRRSRRS